MESSVRLFLKLAMNRTRSTQLDFWQPRLQNLKNSAVHQQTEVCRMAHPIELGLVLEGEDARDFLEDLKNPKATKEQIEMFKEAIRLYKEHPF
jgi:hypothetical protein